MHFILNDILNIKDVIIQWLQEDNLKIKERVGCLEDKVVQLELKIILWNNMGVGAIYKLRGYQPAYQMMSWRKLLLVLWTQ